MSGCQLSDTFGTPLPPPPAIKQAVAVVTAAFTKEALRRQKERLAVVGFGRYTGARVGMTGE